MAAMQGANQLQNGQKPLVALLDGRDCSIEMPLLKANKFPLEDNWLGY